MTDTKTAQQGSNSSGLENEAKIVVERILTLKEEQASIGGEIRSEMAALVEKGIPRRAISRVLQDIKTERDENKGPERRREIDAAYMLVRGAMDLPTQLDLLDNTPAQDETSADTVSDANVEEVDNAEDGAAKKTKKGEESAAAAVDAKGNGEDASGESLPDGEGTANAATGDSEPGGPGI